MFATQRIATQEKEAIKKIAALMLSLALATGPALAESPKEGNPAPAKPAAAKTTADVAEEVEELRQELQILKEALARRDKQIDEAQKVAAEANARAAAAVARSNEANETFAAIPSVTAAVALNPAPEATPNPTPQSRNNSEEGPIAIRFKGVSLTPGGYLAGETVTRTHATSGDLPTAFTAIPFSGNSLADVSEFNFSGRQSRLSMLVEGKVGSTTLNGYAEADFLGAGTTSNNRQTNSYVFRQRQLFALATFASGWSITGGLQWSLITEVKKGIVFRMEKHSHDD